MADWVTGRWGAMVASAFQRKRQIPGMHPAASSTTPFGRDDSGPSTEITDVSSAAKKEIFSGGGVFFFFFWNKIHCREIKYNKVVVEFLRVAMAGF
jgi:hypothetical protein